MRFQWRIARKRNWYRAAVNDGTLAGRASSRPRFFFDWSLRLFSFSELRRKPRIQKRTVLMKIRVSKEPNRVPGFPDCMFDETAIPLIARGGCDNCYSTAMIISCGLPARITLPSNEATCFFCIFFSFQALGATTSVPLLLMRVQRITHRAIRKHKLATVNMCSGTATIGITRQIGLGFLFSSLRAVQGGASWTCPAIEMNFFYFFFSCSADNWQ